MNVKTIYSAFDGKLVGNAKMKRQVCETLLLMPEEIIAQVTKTCWFMASMEDAWAFTFTGNELKDQHLIFLSDELLLQDEAQIHYTIAHEIGHVVLGHRNSVLVQQSKAEIQKQEQEADTFAKQYLV
jgi:Zn-dependent peptidase ImmA (M78 family)